MIWGVFVVFFFKHSCLSSDYNIAQHMKIAIDSAVRLKPQRSSLFFTFKSSFCPLFVLNHLILPTEVILHVGFLFLPFFFSQSEY